MITHGTQIASPDDLDYCELIGCLWIVLRSGGVSACLRCQEPYPHTMEGIEPIIDLEDGEPFT